MKIIAIDKRQSTSDSIVFTVEPPLPREVFDVFEQNLPNDPMNPGLRYSFLNGSIRVHSSTIPQGLDAWLTQRLAESKGLIDHVKSIEEEKKRIAEQQKQEILDAAAKRTGLPIR